MISDARGGHVSPGVYTEEREVTYSVDSLGITSLGLVGETLYGPAFEPVEITKWSEFIDYFGGCSTEKFKETGMPKYGLPYIAKSYLEESNRLNVVRVLGLSGYNAGKAYVVSSNRTPIVVLRSKLTYNLNEGNTNCSENFETAQQVVTGITVIPYNEVAKKTECYNGEDVNDTPKGKFGLHVSKADGTTVDYHISLNPNDGDYIYNVLGGRPDIGTTPIYIEAVYENSNYGSTFELEEIEYATGATLGYLGINNIRYSKDDYKVVTKTEGTVDEPEYVQYIWKKDKEDSNADGKVVEYKEDIKDVTYDYTDFNEAYRYAQTPWIVSEVSGDETSGTTLRKLFKLVTISDGDAANYQVKVSIQNISPRDGTFDVAVRDFYDSDTNPLVLELFRNCNLVEGDANYVAFKIGSVDGGYISKSKYIAVEMADGDFRNSIPAGFLGYPMPKYGGLEPVEVKYKTKHDTTKKVKTQYFGCSKEFDADILKYKGKHAYSSNVELYTKGFHMDSILKDIDKEKISVDGVSGYTFSTVEATSGDYQPRLISVDKILSGTIYNDIKARKFTVCFYGGFDGWDVNRGSRTNTDKYKGTVYSSTEGLYQSSEEMIQQLNLPAYANSSDYYAYLAGYKTLANPQDVDINLLATPGINWYDNTLLTEEVIDIVTDSEDGRGGDTLYIMESPDGFTPKEIADEIAAKDIQSSYACTYYPWIMYYDTSNKKYLNLPVTKDVVRNMAATDNNSYPWFAPAGLERGKVNCVKAQYKTTLADEDTLYSSCVNPVKSFARDGVKIWGNKTVYSIESPLNRINVRRLMLRVKKLIVDASKQLIFEQYDNVLENQFRGIVEPILSDVKSKRGISDFRVVTEVTPETRDQHILPAKILIKPTPALEYISISFVVYPESVSFEE